MTIENLSEYGHDPGSKVGYRRQDMGGRAQEIGYKEQEYRAEVAG